MRSRNDQHDYSDLWIFTWIPYEQAALDYDLLDGSFSEAKILDFLDMSYDLIDGAGRKEENVSGLQ